MADDEKNSFAQDLPLGWGRKNNSFAEDEPEGFVPVAPTKDTSVVGSFSRHVAGGVVPSVGGLAGAGPGIEIGTGIGAAIGSVFPGPGTIVGGAIGGFIGGVGGFFAGSAAAEMAQSWAVKKLPPSWQDSLGATDRQKILDETEHPVASFLGGLVAMTPTMMPGKLTMKALSLAENATATQRIYANPVLGRVFSGAVMGGMEVGQEAWGGEDVDWRKVAASTVFGMVFNKPTRLGEGLLDLGARPIRAGKAAYMRGTTLDNFGWSNMYGRTGKATVAEAGDRKVLGAGVTEEVWEGTQLQDPAAEAHAQEVARSEMEMYGPYETDIHAHVRRMEPDLFEEHDSLIRQRNILNGWLRETQPASVDIQLQMLDSRAARLQQEAQKPMWGPERRTIEAQLQDIEGQRQILLERKAAPLIGETSGRGRQLREDIAAVDAEIGRLSPEIAAAYRRAEDYLGGRPETAREPYEGSAVPPGAPEPRATAEMARTVAQQAKSIAADVEAKLIAAGRPADEAREAGVWWAQRLVTRAAQWEGRLGTAEQIYQRLNLQVVGPGGRTLTPVPAAGGTAPAVPAAGGPVAPAAAPTAPVAAAASPAVPAYAKGWTVGTKLDLGNIKDFTVKEILPDGQLLLERPTGQLMRLELPKTEPKDPRGMGWAQHLFNVSPAELRATPPVEEVPVEAKPLRSAQEIARGAMEAEEPVVSRETPPADRGAGPDEMEREAGERLGAFLKENNLPDSARVDLAEHYRRAPGEEVEVALARAVLGREEKLINEVLAVEGASAEEKADAELLWNAFLSDQESFGADLRLARVQEGAGKGMPYTFQGAGAGAFSGEGTSRPGISVEAPERARGAIRRPYSSEEPPFNADQLEIRPGLRSGEETRGEVSAPEREAAGVGEVERRAGEAGGEAAGAQGAAEEAPLVNLLDRMTERARQTAGTKGQEPVQGERQMLMDQVARRLPRTSDEFLEKLLTDLEAGKYGGPEETKALTDAAFAELNGRVDKILGERRETDIFADTPAVAAARAAWAEHGAEVDRRFGSDIVGASLEKRSPEFIAEDDRLYRAFKDAEGQILEQRRNMVKLGSISLEEGRTLITLARTADASSFIHESWHAWWKQMMDDAELPGVPEQIKRDVRIIFDELGVKDRAEFDALTRKYSRPSERQQNPSERVAMWGEQYSREGRAPSKELIGVFQRFYEWLQSIYQSIESLGTPINDNIRGVFARMEAMNPESIVVAKGERKTGGPTISEIQRADAEFTSPQDAAATAARVDMERELEAQKPPVEVQSEIQSEVQRVEAEQVSDEVRGVEPGGESGEGAAGSAEVVQGGLKPATESGGGGVGEGAGAQRGGGGPTVAEGSSLRGREEPAAGDGANAGPPLSPRPSPIFSGADTVKDKAGNIRLELLKKVANFEDFRKFVRDIATANGDFMEARGRPVTEGEVEDLARAIGFEGANRLVRDWVKGQVWNAAEVRAVRNLLDQMVPDVWEKSRVAGLDGASEADVLAFSESFAQLRDIQRAVSGITAEWGRAGLGFRDLKRRLAEGDRAAQQVLWQMREQGKLLGAIKDPAAVAKFMRDSGKHSYSRMVLEYWINNLISGPATHTTYMIGNMMLAFSKFGPEAFAGAMVGHVAEAMGRKGERMHAGEVFAAAQGFRAGFVPAIQASIESLRTGVTAALPGESAASMRQFQYIAGQVTAPVLNEAAKWSDVVGSLWGLNRAIRDSFVSTAALVDANGERMAPFMGTEHSLMGSIPNWRVGQMVLPTGTVIRLPSRAVGSIHSFFRAVNYSMEKASVSYRDTATAAAEAARNNQPFDFNADLAKRWADPSEEKMAQFVQASSDLALMGKGSRFTQALSKLVNTEVFGRFDKNGEYIHGIPLLKFIDPFVHISSNLLDQALFKRTPLGILSAEIRADIAGKNGGVAQDRAIGRMLVGTAFGIAVGGLAAQGLITGDGPKDWREAALWRQAYQPHSVRIGDFWYSTQRLGVLGMLLGVGADLYEVTHLIEKDEGARAFGHFQHAILQNILDESFMRGPADLIQAIEHYDRYGAQYIRNLVSSFVPFSVGMGQEARAIDPYSREARTVVDALTAKIPFLSQSLLPRVDIWGQPMPNRDALATPGLTAVYMQKVNSDPVKQAMVRLGMQTAPVNQTIRGVELTPEQHYEYAVYSGRMAKSRLDVIVQSPDWQRWEPEQQRAVIQAVVRGSREAAGGLIMAKDPTIPVRAVQQKRDLAHHTNELPD